MPTKEMSTIARPCPLCHSEKHNLIFQDHNRREGYVELVSDYVECQQCGMRYLTNIPNLDSMAEKYSEIYVQPNLTELKSQLKAGVRPNGKRILDIGCNHGIQLIPYHNSGWEIYGIDLNAHAITDCKKYLPADQFQVSTIEDAPFEKEFFDKIQTNHVLEHVYEPLSFLKRCHVLLKNGGELDIRIPHGNSLEMIVWGKHSSQSWVPFHINMFNAKNIREMLEKAGFKNVRTKTNAIPWWWILSYRQWNGTINTKKWETNFSQNFGHKLLQVALFPALWIVAKLGYGEELHISCTK